MPDSDYYGGGQNQAQNDLRYVMLGAGAPGQTLSGGIYTYAAGKQWNILDSGGNKLLAIVDTGAPSPTGYGLLLKGGAGPAMNLPTGQGYTVANAAGAIIFSVQDAGTSYFRSSSSQPLSLGVAGLVSDSILIAATGAVTLAPPAGLITLNASTGNSIQMQINGVTKLNVSAGGQVTTPNTTLDDGTGTLMAGSLVKSVNQQWCLYTSVWGAGDALLYAFNPAIICLGTDANKRLSLDPNGSFGGVTTKNNTLDDGAGNVTIAGTPTLTTTRAAGTNTATLSNSVTAGNPAVWVAIKVGATTYYVPGWT